MRRCHGEPWTDSWTEPLAEVGATSVTGAWICGIRAGSAPRAPGRAPHNPPVVGSSPTRPTSMVFTFEGTPRQDSSLGVVPGHRHCHSRRPCQCPGLLRIPAALPRHHHTEKEPVRFLRHAMCPTTKSTKTITIISSILIPIPPGARNCSEEASGLLRPADGGRSSCPNEASLLRGDFRST